MGANRFLCELIDTGDYSRSGDRDSIGTDAEASLISHYPDRFHHFIVVQKTFSHPHKDQVNSVPRFCTGAIDLVEDDDDLRDDLASRHIPFDAELRGHTEAATNRAADLATEANGVSMLLGHKDGFGFTAVAEFEQIAPGSIDRRENLGDFGFSHTR